MTTPGLDIIGTALADSSRSRMLCELMDGRAFTNKELACVANIAPQTASAHLKHLEAVGLTTSLRSGRCVYHRIANENVAIVMEHLANLTPVENLQQQHAKVRHLPGADTMRARSCYNHIAGRLGVLLTERLAATHILSIDAGHVVVGPAAEAFFHNMGITPPLDNGKKPIVKLCLDWTERKHHISGPFATTLMSAWLEKGWLRRFAHSRALDITTEGYQIFERELGLTHKAINAQ